MKSRTHLLKSCSSCKDRRLGFAEIAASNRYHEIETVDRWDSRTREDRPKYGACVGRFGISVFLSRARAPFLVFYVEGSLEGAELKFKHLFEGVDGGDMGMVEWWKFQGPSDQWSCSKFSFFFLKSPAECSAFFGSKESHRWAKSSAASRRLGQEGVTIDRGAGAREIL